MKKFQEYALVAVIASLLSVALSLSATSLVLKKKLSSGDHNSRIEKEMEYGHSINSANNYGFQNTSLSLNPGRQVGTAPDLIPAAEASVHAVVHIKVQGEKEVARNFIDPFDFFFGGDGGFSPNQRQPIVGYGSGVIISEDGYIITNNHVIEDADKIEVTLNDNRTFKAKKIGSDPDTDIALLKIEAKNLPTIPFGNSDDLKVGEWVLAVGNPFNLTSTVTSGIVSAKARPAGTSDGKSLKIGGFIQTDAAVNAGNSGGALVNAKGELVGINTMIYSQTGNFAGYSFAVPINSAAKVVSDIKKYGTVQRGVLGVVGGDITPEIKEKYDLKVNSGAFIDGFSEISPAYAAGIDKHDVIVAINGKNVKTFTEVQAVIAMHKPGDKVKIKVDRKGVKKDFVVTLKNIQGNEKLIRGNSGMEMAGLKLKKISAGVKRQYGISYGLEVVSAKKRFREVGIKEGFIILSIDNVAMKDIDIAKKVISSAMQAPKGRRYITIRGFYPNRPTIQDFLVEL